MWKFGNSSYRSLMYVIDGLNDPAQIKVSPSIKLTLT